MTNSLKIKEVVKRLPDNAYNIAKTMREVGYADSTTRSGQQYARIQRAVQKAFNPEQLKADLLKAEKDFTKAEDNSNRARMLELRAKILGLTKEVQAGQQVMININDTLDKLKNPKPIDVGDKAVNP